MPKVARKDGKDKVKSPDGGGVSDANKPECKIPSTQVSDKGSSNVFVNNIGVVRLGDAMKQHQGPDCAPHAPTLSKGSPTVFANNKAIGRKDDPYGGDHPLSTGSDNVFADS